jgi:hypothetical protein
VPLGKHQMENLDRGVVAVQASGGVYVGWRLLGQDPDGVGFNVYRDGVKVNGDPLTSSTNLLDPGGRAGSTYAVRAVVSGAEQSPSEATAVWSEPYLTIPLQTPDGYLPNDASAGDLDGDGRYEIVLKVECCGQDNAYAGVTGQPKLEAYELDGTFLWRIDLGVNIREGAHYTQFMVYDLDGDGRAAAVRPSPRPRTSRRAARSRAGATTTATASIASWRRSPISMARAPAWSCAAATTRAPCWPPGTGGTASSRRSGPSTPTQAPAPPPTAARATTT